MATAGGSDRGRPPLRLRPGPGPPGGGPGARLTRLRGAGRARGNEVRATEVGGRTRRKPALRADDRIQVVGGEGACLFGPAVGRPRCGSRRSGACTRGAAPRLPPDPDRVIADGDDSGCEPTVVATRLGLERGVQEGLGVSEGRAADQRRKSCVHAATMWRVGSLPAQLSARRDISADTAVAESWQDGSPDGVRGRMSNPGFRCAQRSAIKPAEWVRSASPPSGPDSTRASDCLIQQGPDAVIARSTAAAACARRGGVTAARSGSARDSVTLRASARTSRVHANATVKRAA
jgi:hypothetical protein